MKPKIVQLFKKVLDAQKCSIIEDIHFQFRSESKCQCSYFDDLEPNNICNMVYVAAPEMIPPMLKN